MDELTVFDPRGRVDAERVALAPRAAALKGLRLGILDNTKWNANRLLRKTAALLEAEHGIFREHGVEDREIRLIFRQVRKRLVDRAGVVVVQDGVSMTEGAAPSHIHPDTPERSILRSPQYPETSDAPSRHY